MASQDPEPPRVGLMSLPKDILKHIVLLAAAQDKAVRKSGIPLASPPASPTMWAGKSTMLPGGKWAYEYGHSLGSLSLVNKAIRVLALPLLIQTVKASQLEKPLFAFRTIEPALLAGITSLDLRKADADSFAASALALEALPSLCRIKMPMGLLDTIKQGDYDEKRRLVPDMVEQRQLALETFQTFAIKITRVDVSDFYAYDSDLQLASIAKFAALPTLRSLVISAAEHQVLISGSAVLKELKGLEDLSIGASSHFYFYKQATDAAQWQSTQLATLRTLKLHADTADVFAFAAHLAPQLDRLEIILSSGIAVEPAKERVAFPSLRHLSLTGPPLCGSALTYIDLSSLSSLSIRIDSAPTAEIASTVLFPNELIFPADLELDIHLHCLLLLTDYDALEARLVGAGVALEYDAGVAPLAPYSPRSDSTVKEPENEMSVPRFAAVVDTLDWVEKRVQQLYSAGDTAAMQEMAEAVKKVAERRMLERL